jgi:glycerophosphoryl diester phosphodiesterase
LTAFPGQYYLLEIKQDSPSIAADVAEILAEHEVLDRVVVASFSSETIADFRAAAPGVFTALSLAEMVALNTNLGDPDYVPPGQFVQPPWESTSKQVIDYAHTLGLKVHPWTVNDTETMNLLMGRGVDGIMTDDPALLESLIP